MNKIKLLLLSFLIGLFFTNCSNLAVKIPFVDNISGYVTSIGDKIIIGDNGIIKRGVNIDNSSLGIAFEENIFNQINFSIGDYISMDKSKKTLFISRTNGEEILLYFSDKENKIEKKEILKKAVR